jgi:DNA mismatch repair protein MutS
MLYDEYEAYVKKYKAEFGDHTIVLYECGSFFEIYDDGRGLVNMKEVSELLNIVVSRRNKNIINVSRNNFEMAGFPSHSLKKFLNILLSNNYTIVLVTQVTPPPNPKRAVTEILSPGVNLDISTNESNNLMVVYIDECERYNSPGIIDISVGCSVIDITTGKSDVYETTSYMRDMNYAYDELYRIISVYSPREIEIISEKSICIEKLKDYVDFGKAYIHDKTCKMDKNLKSKQFQENIIHKAFSKTGLLSPIEYLDLERKPMALISFIRLLQFTYIHNENIINNIKKPNIIDDTDILLLSYNSASQLDIIARDTKKTGSLMNILNNCKTAIGKRYFKKRLLNPYISVESITREYDLLDKINKDDNNEIRQRLSSIYDIERLYRKCNLGIIHPHEFYNFLKSIDIVNNIQVTYNIFSIDLNIGSIVRFTEEVLHIENLILYNLESIENDIFIKGYDKELDNLQSDLNNCMSIFYSVLRELNTGNEGYMKLDSTDKEGYYFTCTSKRFQEIMKTKPVIVINKDNEYKLKDFTCKTFTTNVKISHPSFDKLNNDITILKHKIEKRSTILFKSFLSKFVTTFDSMIDEIIRIVERYDFITNNKYNNDLYRLVRPCIDGNKKSSEVKVTGLRHLIIENVQKDVKYITNDISLGDDYEKGILLYGINSAGKSSLMKSIGIAIIMAQCGMYVPCDSMLLSPYRKIFTRIFSCDDIFKGQSTFTKEIIELRNIMKRADEHSLIIGDELCSGTESISALSIVSAGIITLSKKQSSFVFATHLHDLVKIDDITKLPNIKVYHLSVVYDDILKKLVYDRKLKPGNGSTLYGIEVCKALDLDIEFLQIANNIRQKILDIDTRMNVTKRSIYNKDIYIDRCALCNGIANEVHHIEQQKDADKDGYINTYHKNSKFNLVCLCESCHDKVHNGSLNVIGYVKTMEGNELKVERLNNGDTKYPSKKELEEYIKNQPLNKSKKEIYNELCSIYNITKYRIDKILRF